MLDSKGGVKMNVFIKCVIGKCMVIVFIEYKLLGKIDENGKVFLFIKVEEVINVVMI